MSKEQFHEIRSNTTFAVDYGSMTLVPSIELIFLNVHPEYEVVRKGRDQFIERGHGLTETRIHCSLKQINAIIGELQAAAASLQVFDQMAAGLNKVIEQARKPETPEP